MNILVFSDAKNIRTAFAKIEKSKDFDLEFFPLQDMKKEVKRALRGTLIYADVGPLEAPAQKRTITFLSKLEGHLFGIIDNKGTLGDVGEVFRLGGCDFIGKVLIKNGLEVKRQKLVFEFGNSLLPEEKVEEKAKPFNDSYILSGTDWKGIRSGKEYTFSFMFIELDNQRELKKKFGGDSLERVVGEFHDYVERAVAPIGGKVWMWMDFGGLILLPFNGTRCDAILAGFKLMMDRKFFSAEEFEFNVLFSFRIALHIGNTVYQSRGDTGEIVSDSINSIFHLGQKFAKPGNLYLTEDVKEFIPPGLEKNFLEAGKFEGREILRMRQLL